MTRLLVLSVYDAMVISVSVAYLGPLLKAMSPYAEITVKSQVRRHLVEWMYTTACKFHVGPSFWMLHSKQHSSRAITNTPGSKWSKTTWEGNSDSIGWRKRGLPLG